MELITIICAAAVSLLAACCGLLIGKAVYSADLSEDGNVQLLTGIVGIFVCVAFSVLIALKGVL